MILYGFRALAKNTNDLSTSDYDILHKSDWDILCSLEEFKNLVKSFGTDIIYSKPSFPSKFYIKTSRGNYDIHIIQGDSSNTDIYNLLTSNKNNLKETDLYGNEFIVSDIELLYFIKKSHLFIRRNFKKHMEDFQKLKILFNHLNIDEKDSLYYNIYKKRLTETLKRAEKQTAHINLNQSKDDFFNTKGISYIYDHDDIHESIKIGEKPAYLKILIPGEDVMCSKELWDKLSYYEKLECVIEEASVIAIERYLSKGAEMSVYEAYCLGLEKICTTLCKGYFRKFACMNYTTVLEAFNPNIYNRFKEALASGKIKSYTKLDERTEN